MKTLSGAYPFILLGFRRLTERAGALGIATFFAVAIAYVPVLLIVGFSLPSSTFFSDYSELSSLNKPGTLFVVLSIGACAATFLLPFLVATASDLYFRVDWRANSILLASPMMSKDLFWGKFTILFLMGLPAFVALIPPLALLVLATLPSMVGFLQILVVATLVYVVSCIYISAFTRRWEAALFWAMLVPAAAIVNSIIWLMVSLANWALSSIHTRLGTIAAVQMLPPRLMYPHIPNWILACCIAIAVLFVLLRKGISEIDKMRKGKIPLGQLSRKSEEDFKRRYVYRWARPEYGHADRAKAVRELYIPVQPGTYALTLTDRVFGFFVALWFLGRPLMLRLVESMPSSLKENPIYVRHTSRFRGFLAGYFEPSGRFKSKVVMQAAFGLFVLWTFLIAGKQGFMVILLVYLLLAIISPFDAYAKLVRLHRESVAWESVILTPMPGSEMIRGTFGVLVAHRLLPLLPGSLWILLIGILVGVPLQFTFVLLAAIYALYFAYLSFWSAVSWFATDKLATFILAMVWFGGFIAIILLAGVLSSWQPIGMDYLNLRFYMSLIATSVVLLLIGMMIPAILGRLFDKRARVPFVRVEEHGG